MNPQFNAITLSEGAYKAMLGLEQYLASCAIETRLLHLIKLRVSQMNGCAYCIDMHYKDLRAAGDSEQRLISLDAWQECPYYTKRERAALAWTEALTTLAPPRASDALYEEVRQHFSEEEIADLTLAIATINGWNRLTAAARTTPGTYQPANNA